MSTLVFELGCEELPSSVLPALNEALQSAIAAGLEEAMIGYDSIAGIAAPRRLGVRIQGLSDRSSPKQIEKRGPAVAAAYSNGEATKALLGFCRGLGITPEQLETEETEKGAWVVYRAEEPGHPTAALIPQVIQSALSQLPMAKPMRWGTRRDVFPRPVHWILCLLDEAVIPVTAFGLQGDRVTFGHRFHAPAAITLAHADRYPEAMASAYVIPEFAQRQQQVWQSILVEAGRHGLTVTEDPALLEEITCLVEWPVALCGSFDPEFLEVPDIALIAAMRGHQKYFHTRTHLGDLSHHFITVANLESLNPDQVIAGNQRVIRARLADARFFFTTDRKTPLYDRLDLLENITFHPKLGSLGDKTRRVKDLAEKLALLTGQSPELAERAAQLSRCDLVSEMVLEFDELQGQMGAIYAAHDGEHQAVAEALAGFYQPAGAHDEIPKSSLGVLIAMADRLDSLAGLFAAGQPPSGSKDPFALRRAAIGLIRLNEAPGFGIDLLPLVAFSMQAQPLMADPQAEGLLVQFIRDRERVRLTDEGMRHDVVMAAQAGNHLNTASTRQRAEAISAWIGREIFDNLVSANKRLANVLGKTSDVEITARRDRLVDPAEEALERALEKVSQTVEACVSRETFDQALEALASLHEPINTFFERIMVNVDDPELRHQRLSLVARTRQLFTQVADLSVIQG